MPISERTGLVEDDSVDATERLKIEPALDDCSEASGSADGANDRQRSTGRNATSTSHNDYRDGRAQVARDQVGQRSSSECKVNKVAGHAVGKSLHRSTRSLGSLHGLDDLSVACVATNSIGTDLNSAGLIDRAGEDQRARGSSRRASTRQ